MISTTGQKIKPFAKEEDSEIIPCIDSDREIVVPTVFSGARLYHDNPDLLEQAQAVFQEEELYRKIEEFAIRWYSTTQRKPRVLDLCAATGLCALCVSNAIPVESVTTVDVNKLPLEKARTNLEHVAGLEITNSDAVIFQSNNPFDLILMNSCYHHIEDERKVSFLLNASKLLSEDGQILLGDHFLPPYEEDNRASFRNSIEVFYRVLVDDLLIRGTPNEVISAFRMAGLSCWLGEYEFKVSMDKFTEDIQLAGLIINKSFKVWPERRVKMFDNETGSFAITLVPFSEE